MAENKLVSPVLKWAGGKRQLLDEILPLLPRRISTYCEPFLGGGAVLFARRPEHAIVNDLNGDLMLVYEVIRDDVQSLIDLLQTHENTPEYFYRMRDLDRDNEAYQKLSGLEKASRMIYLNKTCFNGLFRVNASGEFNTPFGRYKKPNIVKDFAATLQRVPDGGFAYLDPPYDPISDTASFTGYNKSGFGREEQIHLKECCDALTERGVKFLLSNSATDFIRALYGAYCVQTVYAKRAVNADAGKRGAVEEVLIRNYGVE